MKSRTLNLSIVFLTGFFMLVNTKTVKAEGILDGFMADQDMEVSVSADVAVYDKYVWRGFKLDGDKVVQPAFTIGVGPFEGGFWGSWDTQSDDGLASDEVDGWIGVNFDLGMIDESLDIVGLSFGNTWYSFPEGDTGLSEGSHTEELYFGVSIDTLLSPSFTWYHDYGDEESGGADGDYFIFSLSHSFTLSDEYGITLDIGEEVGFLDEAFIMGDGGYSTTTVGVTIPLTDNVSMSPSLAYTSPFGDLEDANDGAQDNEFWGGIIVSFSN